MSTVKNVDVAMFLKVALSKCTLYILIYIRMKAWYDAENWLENPKKNSVFKVIFVIFCYNKKRTKTKEASYDSSNHFIRKDYRARLR